MVDYEYFSIKDLTKYDLIISESPKQIYHSLS